MSAITIKAPAKLNLHLKVGDRRPDGFHDLESLFAALAWGDTLHFEATPSPAIIPPEICMNWQLGGPLMAPPPEIPPENNIISRAISLFGDRSGFYPGLKVTVEKRIPPGGGLGGGSANAAATLLALNYLAGADGVSVAELAEMGAFLGSDVPFFVYEAPAAWVTGRGEQVQPLDLPETLRGLPVVLVNPGFASDTAEAYRLLDLWREETHTKARRHEGGEGIRAQGSMDGGVAGVPPAEGGSGRPPEAGWSEGGDFPLRSPFSNDFLPIFAASEKGAAYQRIIAELRELGAEFAGLSGSGSTCFGVFSGQDRAESAQNDLLKRWPFVIITFFSCVSGKTMLQL